MLRNKLLVVSTLSAPAHQTQTPDLARPPLKPPSTGLRVYLLSLDQSAHFSKALADLYNRQ